MKLFKKIKLKAGEKAIKQFKKYIKRFPENQKQLIIAGAWFGTPINKMPPGLGIQRKLLEDINKQAEGKAWQKTLDDCEKFLSGNYDYDWLAKFEKDLVERVYKNEPDYQEQLKKFFRKKLDLKWFKNVIIKDIKKCHKKRYDQFMKQLLE